MFGIVFSFDFKIIWGAERHHYSMLDVQCWAFIFQKCSQLMFTKQLIAYGTLIYRLSLFAAIKEAHFSDLL